MVNGWFYNSGIATLTYNLTPPVDRQVYQTIMGFDDIESDEPLIGRERSEYYVARMLLHVFVHFVPNNEDAPVRQFLNRGTIALVTVANATGGDVLTTLDPWTSDAGNVYERLFREEVFQLHTANPFFVTDPGSVATDDSPEGGNVGYPLKPLEFHWDLDPKFRLPEGRQLGLNVGIFDNDGENGDTLTVAWAFKALLRKRA